MKKPLSPFARKLLFLPPIAAGVIALVTLRGFRTEPERHPEKEAVRTLRVIQAPEIDVIPRALGYGTAEPADVWQAVAEVKGRVQHVHQELQSGSILKKGETAIQIDPTEYQLAVTRLEAEILQAEAKLDQLDTQQRNDEESLKIERESLALAESELDRQRDLLRNKAASASAVEQQTRTVLTQRQSTQSLTNSLNLIPAEKKSIEAGIAVTKTQLQQAKLDLEKTVIKAPFDCRIGPVSIEADQFLSVGQTLFDAHGIDVIEVEAQVAPHHIRNLLVRPDGGTVRTVGMETVRSIFQVDAIVRFGVGDLRAEWPARFVRVREDVNADTRTLGVVFAIDDPYAKADPGESPPPLKGTFCEVEIRSRKRLRHVIVPRTALHDGHAYIVDSQGRLERRKVEPAFRQSGFVAIREGVSPDETIVVSDPTPAVEGMLVDGVVDDALRAELVDAAEGRGQVR